MIALFLAVATLPLPWLFLIYATKGTPVAKLSVSEENQARMGLQAAGCPSEAVDAIVAAGTPWSVIQAILAFVAAHPGLANDFWTLLQVILAGGVP